MSYLVDTNIISELRKRERCDARVQAWYAGVPADDLYLSVLVLGEIRKGIELAGPRDPAKASALQKWLERVETAFAERILPVDAAVAERWGQMNAIRPAHVIDGLMAATAATYDLTLVTRNNRDLAGLGAKLLNPFQG